MAWMGGASPIACGQRKRLVFASQRGLRIAANRRSTPRVGARTYNCGRDACGYERCSAAPNTWRAASASCPAS